MRMNLFRLSLRAASAAAFFVGLSACQMTPAREYPTPGAGWHTSVGQLQYATPQRSVIGEAVVSSLGTQDFQLDFTAGPGVPLMRLRETGNSARAEGPFAGGSWQGDPARPPRQVASWAALREAFSAVNATRAGSKRGAVAYSAAGAGNPWIAKASSGEPRRVSVEFPRTNERFVFVFAR